MKKTSLKNTLNEINLIGLNMPRSINEALGDPSLMDGGYSEETEEPVDGTDAQGGDETGVEQPVDQSQEQQPVDAQETDVQAADGEAVNAQPAQNTMNPNVGNVPAELRTKVSKFVDSIRKMSLKGMSDLADYPNSAEYELLKKLWQTTDKKPEQKNGGTL